MDDARDIWNAVKARFGGNAESKKMRKSMLKQEFLEFRIRKEEGLHKGYDRIQKILSQLNQLKSKPDAEDINLKFLRALPSSWSQTLEVDVKGYNTFSSSQSAGPSHSAFVSATSTIKKISYGDSPNHSSTTTYYVSSNSKTGSYRSVNVFEDVLQSFVADTEPEQQLAYEDLEQIEKLDLEEIDLKWQMAMLSVKIYSSFKIKEIGKKEEDSKAFITIDTLVDWINRESESDGVIAAKEFGMIVGCDSKDAIKVGAAKLYNLITGANSEEANTVGDAGEFALMGVTFEVHNCPFGCDNKYNELKKQYNEINEQHKEYFIQVQAYKNSLKTLEKQKRVLQRNQLTLEDKIRVLSIELENTSNLLKHSKRINVNVETAKKDLQTKFDNHLVQTEKWRNSSKNLFKLIDSSIVFTTTSKDVEGRLVFHRFAKTDSMKAVPPPFSGDYTSLSDHINLDESQMSYGTKSSTSCDSKSMYNDFVSCDDSDKSSEVNTNDFTSSDSSVNSLEHQPNGSTSRASTFSVSITENEAERESHIGTPIKEPSIVQDLPSFTCNSSDKNEHTSRTSCNENGSFNKKAGHFRKHASFVSKLCFVCGSGTHLIKDYDFYKKQMANKTVGIRVGPAETSFLATEDEGIFDSGCSRSMTGNKARLDDFQAFHGQKVTFGGDEGRITGKGTIRTPTLDFENVYYVNELQQFNLFSISQICDKKNQVLFTDIECLVLSKDLKLLDDSMVVLKISGALPRTL
uniref:Ribonuclease H-like domain-containing protein n=1 Tax=Tanacetum cinerariifolium TaxID=118510 RepID=A0A6L2NED2_TANCI|nr:ribonuclease H-like domain-containing protein [Tanacetum cinerariifolium]